MTAAQPKPGPRHWMLAFGGALLLHAAMLLVFHQPPDNGAVATGLRGIEVGLGSAGGAPGASPSEAPPAEAVGAEVAEAVEVAPAEAAAVPPEAAQEAAAEPPPAPAEAAAVEPAPAVAAEVPLYAPVTPEEAGAPASQRTEEPAVEETAAVPARAVASPPLPKPRPRPQPPQAAAPPEAPDPSPKPVEAAEVAADAGAAAADAPGGGAPETSELSGSDGRSGTGSRAAAGDGGARSGGGSPGAVVDYKARLLAWLEQHKAYPRRAKLRRQEGIAQLHFVIDREGRLLDYRIEKSTGHRFLDEEVAAMVERASPMPAPPEAVQGESLRYTVPVEFRQR